MKATRQLHDLGQSLWLDNITLIKIPGTPEGIPAIEASIFAGVPVNETLLFSAEQYLAAQLQREGTESFDKSWQDLLECIGTTGARVAHGTHAGMRRA